MNALPRGWFERPAPDLAPLLLNKLLVSTVGGNRAVGRIIEVEAYAEDDPASHTFRGRTARNSVMFGPPGHLYVYLSYGIHHCANVVVGEEGVGSAVLLRAVTPIEGLETIRNRRHHRADRDLTNGPGKVGEAFGLDLTHNGADLTDLNSPVILADDGTPPPAEPLVGPRIGLTKAVDTTWRFRSPRQRCV